MIKSFRATIALLNLALSRVPPDLEPRDEQAQKHGEEVDHAPVGGGRGHPLRHLYPDPRQQCVHVAREPDGDHRHHQGVLQQEVPSDKPRKDLTEHRVGVRVGAAGDRDHAGELRVA
jgi:hypothetical protein